MALRLAAKARSGEMDFDVPSAYLQARPLVMDKGTRPRTDKDGKVVLVNGEPVTEGYWYVVVELRWWTADPDQGGRRISTAVDQIKMEIDPADIQSNLIAELYGRLREEPRFADATDA